MKKVNAGISVIDPSHPIDYAKIETPPNYVCGDCGATGCKLWRFFHALLSHQKLRCAVCAGQVQKLTIVDINAQGRHVDPDGYRSNQIGYMVPAVPTEENDSYWGYLATPESGWLWWERLPSLAKK